jgi:hypothetical protein
MASKTEDPDKFLSHLESLLSYHEGSNNTDRIPVYDGPPIDNRQAAILKRLDGLIAKRKDDATVNQSKAQAEEDRIRRDLNPRASVGTVC